MFWRCADFEKEILNIKGDKLKDHKFLTTKK